ncbi:alpha/beta-hydrolase [Lindgomyces ingoldianus]|uniref:Alpha/beta-hydrolase n=1 Tax=Lindgomyces ingoldianus TaxID=673940 RepID=A0ACB6QI12_9PLEO|nr:alpha/beta-hydrolase [Lindgomyces ingoldianus]KAF2465757.1 alpha/beta-hydrolase [Lindgomyces ingoldianus]
MNRSQHPIYGPTPQDYGLPPPQVYGTYPRQPYGSPPVQPGQPHIGNSKISFTPSHAPKEKEGRLKSSWHKVDKIASKSVSDLRGTLASGAGKSSTCLQNITSDCIDHSTSLLSKTSTQCLNQGAALCDIISSKLDAVITSMDVERFSGDERDLMVQQASSAYSSSSTLQVEVPRGRAANPVYPSSTTEKASNHFSKVWLYANSRLPPHLPPFKVYMPTYPLLCLAATYSLRVYTPPAPRTAEQETHVPSDWRSGTKAMVLKSIPIDDMNIVVFAIRGSQTFMDWAVNFRPAPSSPSGFLDDEGNLCHSGFLHVARQMVKPVAERLKALLQENPSRSNCSLLITGHSAGGAVAALLYAHMMSTQVKSDLNHLTGFFKRVHCITFGAPPISLLPLRHPTNRRHRKSLFYSFINEGDPVPRADKQVVRSLLKLYASPAPSSGSACSTALASLSKLNLSSTNSFQTTSTSSASSRPSKFSISSSKNSKTSAADSVASQPVWNVPASTLSTAGRLVVLRKRVGGSSEEDIEAVTVDDELLRDVVFGDPLKHMMTLYKSRVELLATRAATARGY